MAASVSKGALKVKVPCVRGPRAAQSPAHTQRTPLQSFTRVGLELFTCWRASERSRRRLAAEVAQNRGFGVCGLVGAAEPGRRPGVGARRAAHSRFGPPPEAVPSFRHCARMARTRKAERPCCASRQISPFWPRSALGAIGGVEALKAEVPNRNAQNAAQGPTQAQHAPPQICRRCGWKVLKLWAENPLFASIEPEYD